MAKREEGKAGRAKPLYNPKAKLSPKQVKVEKPKPKTSPIPTDAPASLPSGHRPKPKKQPKKK